MDIPFYSNPDDTHCFQACLRSVLKYFRSTEDYSWDALDMLSGKRSDKWTWPLYGVGQLYKSGFQAELIEDFDYSKFITNPNEYLLARFGKEAGMEQIQNSDIVYEVEVAKNYSSLTGTPRIPTIENLEEFLQRGFLPICCLNLPALYGEPGYLGHFVLPTAIEQESIVFHDPGINTDIFPARQNSKVSRKQFEDAWANDRFVVGLKAT